MRKEGREGKEGENERKSERKREKHITREKGKKSKSRERGKQRNAYPCFSCPEKAYTGLNDMKRPRKLKVS